MILKSHSLRQCSLMTDNDFQLQLRLRLRLITTFKKQTTTNNDHDNDLIIPDFGLDCALWVKLGPSNCKLTFEYFLIVSVYFEIIND